MEQANWMGRWMAPLYGEGGVRPQVQGMPDVIYAPTLDYAFKLARTRWPTANAWTCLGRQDPSDPEVCLDA